MKYKYLPLNFSCFLFGVIISIIALFSEKLNLGLQENFIFYEYFYLNRKNSLVLGIVLILFSIRFLLIRFNKKIIAIYENKVSTESKFSLHNCIFLLLAISGISFIFSVNHTAFEWTTTADIPIIIKLINPEFLKNDFYVNGVVNSPKTIFSYFIYMFTFLGMDWYPITYFFKFFLYIIKSSLIFVFFYSIYCYWLPNDFAKTSSITIRKFIFFYVVFISIFNFAGAPFGWTDITNYQFLSAQTLSFTLGLIYNILCFSKNKFYFLTTVILMFSTFIHPVIGIFHFIITCLFLTPHLLKNKILLLLFFNFCIGLLIPLIYINFIYTVDSPLDASVFIDYYVNIRHPHHFKMSEVLNINSFLWIILFALPIIYSIKVKNKNYIILSISTFLLFILSPIIQYLGTELWNIKKIAVIGPSRFTSYMNILFGGVITLVICSIVKTVSHQGNNLFLQNNFRSIKNLWLFANNFLVSFKLILISINNIIRRKIIKAILILIFLCVTFIKTYNHPLDYYYKGEARTLIEWIINNTSKESIFFTKQFNPFLLRIYSERAIFADSAFPFNESYMEEFIKRYYYFQNFETFDADDFGCLKELYDIDFLITSSSKEFINIKPIFSSKSWKIYSLDLFPIKNICNENIYLSNS